MANIKKIVCISDIHCGGKHNLESLVNELNFFITWCKEYKPDIIFILGDLFDKKLIVGSPHDVVCRDFINSLLSLKCHIIYVNGTYTHDTNSINSYEKLISDKFKIYKTVDSNYLDGLHMLYIPEENHPNKEKYYEKFFLEGTQNKFDLIVGHGLLATVPFLDKIYKKGTKSTKIIFFEDDFKNIINGCVVYGHYHIHLESRSGLLNYTGSFSRDSFGEDEPKGFMIIEYDTNQKKILKKEFIENTLAPIYKTVNAEKIQGDGEELFKSIEKIKKGTYSLRIIIDSDISDTRMQSFLAYSYGHPEVVIQKQFRGLSKKQEEERNNTLSEKREKRHKLLERFRDLDFMTITQIFAKERFNLDISVDEIKELLK